MTLQTVYLASSVSGAATDPQNAVGNTPATWAGVANSNTSWTHRWSFTTPDNPDLTGNQAMVVRVRKGSNSGNPTVSSINVYQGGTQVYSHGSTTVTSATGQDINLSWTPSGPSTQVDIEVVTSAVGGSPSARNSVQVAYASWVSQTVVTNVPPVVDAGLNQSVSSGSVVTLSGSATDPDGTIVSYLWEQTAGPTVTLNRNGATATFTAQDAGTYTFRLTATDNEGATGSATVNVESTNLLPVAIINGPVMVEVGAVVELDGSASYDPEGQDLIYNWEHVFGPAVTLSGTGATRSFTPTEVGDYIFSLLVFDGVRWSEPVFFTVSAAPPSTPGQHPKISTLVDDFNDPSTVRLTAGGVGQGQPGELWYPWNGTYSNLSVSNGRLSIVRQSSPTSLASAESFGVYDLQHSSITVQWAEISNQRSLIVSLPYENTDFSVGMAKYSYIYTDGRYSGGTGSDTHQDYLWWRISEIGGNFFIYGSHDGESWLELKRFMNHGWPREKLDGRNVQLVRNPGDPAGPVYVEGVNVSDAEEPSTAQWSVVQGGVMVELPDFEGVVENGAISLATPDMI